MNNLLTSRREFVWGLAGTALALVIFFIFAGLGWPGNPSNCALKTPDTCFCERFQRPGDLIKQPANTLGNIGFITAGLLILWRVGGDRAVVPTRRNPMTRASVYATAYGAIVIALGPGSMFFHGSITDWGNWLDTFSMILFGSFGLLYTLMRVLRLPPRVFWAVYAAVNVWLGVYSWLVKGTGTPIFTVLIALWVGTEVVIVLFGLRGVRRDWHWLVAALGTFALALLIWSQSQTGRAFCDPESPLQGHAVWHVLSGVAAGMMFLYLRTETRADSSPQRRRDAETINSY